MTKKISKILIVIAMVLSLAMVFAACNPTDSVVVSSITVKSIPNNVEIKDFNISNVKISVTDSNGNVVEVVGDWTMLSDEDKAKLATAGTHDLTFTYEGKTAVVSVTLLPNKVAPVDPDVKKVTVNFVSNGGSVIDAVIADELVTISSEPIPTKANKNFAGWYTDRNFTSERISFETGYTTTKSVTLYARWADQMVTITFDGNGGGAAVGNIPTAQQIVKGERMNSSTNPTRVGYDFSGWYKTAACADDGRIDKLTTSFLTDTTIYAKWLPASFDMIFGLESGSLPNTYVKFVEVTSVPQLFNIEYRPFANGRFVLVDGSYVIFDKTKHFSFVEKINGEYALIDGKYVLYDAVKYPNYNGLKYGKVEPTRYNRYEVASITGTLARRDDGVLIPYRYDATFTQNANGYYTQVADRYVPYNPQSHAGSSFVRFDISVKANPLGEYALVAGEVKPLFESSFKFGANTSSCITPVKAGFKFLGWFELGTSEFYVFGTMPASKVTLVAQWEVLDSTSFLSYVEDVDGHLIITGANSNYPKANTATSLTVPSIINSKIVKGIAANAFKGFTALKTLVLSEGLEFLGDGAFADSALTAVTIAQTINSIGKDALGKGYIYEKVGDFNLRCINPITNEYAVLGYNGGESVVFPAEKKIIEIGSGAFEGKTISAIEIPATVKRISANAFNNCVFRDRARVTVASGSQLEFIDATAFAGTSINDIKGAIILGDVFYKYNGTATNITIPAHVKYLSSRLFESVGDKTTFTFENQNNIIGIGEDVFTTAQAKLMAGDSDWFIINGILVKYLGNGGIISVPETVREINSKAFYKLGSSTYIKIMLFNDFTSGAQTNTLVLGAKAFYGLANINFVFYDTKAPTMHYTAFCNPSLVGYTLLEGAGIYLVDRAEFENNATWKQIKSRFVDFGVEKVELDNSVEDNYAVDDTIVINNKNIIVTTNDGNTYMGNSAKIKITNNIDTTTSVVSYLATDGVRYVKDGAKMIAYVPALHGAVETFFKTTANFNGMPYYSSDSNGLYVNTAAAEAQPVYAIYDRTLAEHKGKPLFIMAYLKTANFEFSYIGAKKPATNVLFTYSVVPSKTIVANGFKEGNEYELGDSLNVDNITLDIAYKFSATDTKTVNVKAFEYIDELNATPVQAAIKDRYVYVGTPATFVKYDPIVHTDATLVKYIKIQYITNPVFDATTLSATRKDGSLTIQDHAVLHGDGFIYNFTYGVKELTLKSIRIDDVVKFAPNGLSKSYVIGAKIDLAKCFVTLVYEKTENGVPVEYLSYISLKDAGDKITFTPINTAVAGSFSTTFAYSSKTVKLDYLVVESTPQEHFVFALIAGTTNEAVITGINPIFSNDKTSVFIPSYVSVPNIGNCKVTRIAKDAFNKSRNVTEITIPASVTSIESGAFAGSCFEKIILGSGSLLDVIPNGAFMNALKLKTVDFGTATVTKIGAEAFRNTGIVGFSVPTQVVELGALAFADNKLLNSVTLNNVATIGAHAFENCKALTTLNITNTVTSIKEGAFAKSGLTTITLPASITALENNLFLEATALASVNVGAITEIGERVFKNCTALTTVTPSDFTKLTKINGEAFMNCDKLNIAIESFTAIKEIAFAAFKNSGLTRIYIPSSVTTIGAEAFVNCSLAKSIIINATSINGANSVPSAIFNECNLVEWLYLNPAIVNVEVAALEGLNSLKGLSSEVASYVAQTKDQFRVIKDKAFLNCKSLVNVGNLKNVTTIGASAFENCSALSVAADLSALTDTGVKAFANSGITSITFGAKLKVIGNYVFANTAITTVSIPATITDIGEGAFANCTQLTNIVIAENNALKAIGIKAFFGNINLTTLSIGLGQKNETKKAYVTPLAIAASAFENCSSLVDLFIPGSVGTIGDYAFRNCGKLATVNIGVAVNAYVYIKEGTGYIQVERTVLADKDMIKPAITAIGIGAFADTPKLNKLYIGCTTAMPTLGKEAFDKHLATSAFTVVTLKNKDALALVEEWTSRKCTITQEVEDYTATTPKYFWEQPTQP
ncbi:MAG: leucine-rich repeat protein [Clostridia bacterium]